MNYFVNENIFTNNGGIEYSAIKRLRLFLEKGKEVKILTRAYNPQLARDLAYVGLDHRSIINLYDYFQEITDAPQKDIHTREIETIDKSLYHIVGVNNDESLIYAGGADGQMLGRIVVAATTYGIVGAVEYWSLAGE
jgi:poly(glycerol-phosphate) alpha-glucosyltransferase